MSEPAEAQAPVELATREQVEAAIAEIGTNGRDLEVLHTALNESLAPIKSKYEENARPHRDRIMALWSAVETWCVANRHELLKGKSKTAKLATGEVSWRMGKSKISIGEHKPEAVIAILRKRRLARFVRVPKPELDVAAMLKDLATIKQKVPEITVTDGVESFSIEPFGAELANAGR